jgi:hypothetical protein
MSGIQAHIQKQGFAGDRALWKSREREPVPPAQARQEVFARPAQVTRDDDGNIIIIPAKPEHEAPRR